MDSGRVIFTDKRPSYALYGEQGVKVYLIVDKSAPEAGQMSRPMSFKHVADVDRPNCILDGRIRAIKIIAFIRLHWASTVLHL